MLGAVALVSESALLWMELKNTSVLLKSDPIIGAVKKAETERTAAASGCGEGVRLRRRRLRRYGDVGEQQQFK